MAGIQVRNLILKQLHRCGQNRRKEPQFRVDVPYVFEFVCVGEMPAIPRQEKVAAMIGCERQMQRIAPGIRRHYVTCDVHVDNRDNLGHVGNKRNIAQEVQRIRPNRIIAALQLFQDRNTGNEFVTLPLGLPPFTGPVSTRHHLRFRTNLKVIAGNRRFYVNSFLHLLLPAPMFTRPRLNPLLLRQFYSNFPGTSKNLHRNKPAVSKWGQSPIIGG